MIKVSVADLQQFKKDSSHIKGNLIIPIYEFIKFDNGTITKTNEKQFVIKELSHNKFTECFLVEELVLNGFIDNTQDDEIFISFENNEITLSDSKGRLKAKTADIKYYPKSPELPSTGTDMDADLLSAIQIASNFTRELDGSDIFPYVFVGKNSVNATNDNIGYHQTFCEKLPELVLLSSYAQKIGGLYSATHYEHDRYLAFKNKDTTYCFIKSTVAYNNFDFAFQVPTKASFTINKEDITTFNNTCIAVSPKEHTATMEMKEDGLYLTMNDGPRARDAVKKVDADGNPSKPFKFLPETLNKLLKAVPDKILTFSETEKNIMYITGESGFISLIMSLQ